MIFGLECNEFTLRGRISQSASEGEASHLSSFIGSIYTMSRVARGVRMKQIENTRVYDKAVFFRASLVIVYETHLD